MLFKEPDDRPVPEGERLDSPEPVLLPRLDLEVVGLPRPGEGIDERERVLEMDVVVRGAVDDVRLLFHVGLFAAQQPNLPRWTTSDEFEPARKAALEALRQGK